MAWTTPVTMIEATDGVVTYDAGTVDLGAIHKSHGHQYGFDTEEPLEPAHIWYRVWGSMDNELWYEATVVEFVHSENCPPVPFSEINYFDAPARYLKATVDFTGTGIFKLLLTSIV